MLSMRLIIISEDYHCGITVEPENTVAFAGRDQKSNVYVCRTTMKWGKMVEKAAIEKFFI